MRGIMVTTKDNKWVPRKILITGGTGSLGRAFVASLPQDCATEVVIFSRDETKQGLLRQQYPQFTYVLGDVAKYRDVSRAMRGVDVVYHFAAYKQVPSAQNNVPATIETNIIGSQNIVDAAIAHGVKQVVASSTDKSTSPANAYGASKYLMEAIFQNGNKYGATTFHLTRYGNVICSNASVIPLFLKQKAAGGPLTVTRKEMTRFWLTLDQAVNNVHMALNYDPGTVLVPKAPAMSMGHLAELIGGGLPVEEIGIRPGEKIHEAMVSEAESFHTLDIGSFYLIYPPTGKVYNDKAPFSYTSDKAPILSDEKMLQYIEDYS